MRTGPRLVVVMALVLGAGGCVRRDVRNSDCRWPGETSNNPATARHLSADPEFAEDLAIRYADTHFGLRSPNPSETYEVERDQCMERLFEEIGKEHGVPVGQVSGSLGSGAKSCGRTRWWLRCIAVQRVEPRPNQCMHGCGPGRTVLAAHDQSS
jgi:hypothetical protein